MFSRQILRCISRTTKLPTTSGNAQAVFHSRLLSTSCTRYYPQVTEKAPYFGGPAVIDREFKDISINDFVGQYIVLFFYPLDFTFVCPTELIAFSDRMKDFNDIHCKVIGVSCDSKYCHLAFIEKPRLEGGLGELKYPLLADYNKEIARNYKVLLESEGVPLRGLFIIDGKGVLRQKTINDLPVGRSVDEVLRLVKAFQFHDKHGEVCPANWQPGGPTIIADPKNAQDYFKKTNK